MAAVSLCGLVYFWPRLAYLSFRHRPIIAGHILRISLAQLVYANKFYLVSLI